jgi:hypothetical protein
LGAGSFGGISKEDVMRQLGLLAGAVALVFAGGARCQERDEGAAPKKALQPLQGVWAAPRLAGGWQFVLCIDGSRATLIGVNDAERLQATISFDLEARDVKGQPILVLRTPTLPATDLRGVALPHVALPGVSIEVPYRLRQGVLVADRAEFKIAGVPLLRFPVLGGEMQRAFPSPQK